MYESEIAVFISSIALAIFFIAKWYYSIAKAWPAGRGVLCKAVLGFLPAVALAVIWPVLATLASFDVVGSPLFIAFYLFLGFPWLWLGELAMRSVFDISMADDILQMDNKSALAAFVGGFLGVTAIYSAANIGDGPGWWCVVFAGGLGFAAWVALALAAGRLSHAFERVTVDRDVPSGIRFGCFLLACGIILGRASSGDWTSASMTVVEFMDGWPALPLSLAVVARERLDGRLARNRGAADSGMAGSVLWGGALVAIAIACAVMLPPLIGKPSNG